MVHRSHWIEGLIGTASGNRQSGPKILAVTVLTPPTSQEESYGHHALAVLIATAAAADAAVAAVHAAAEVVRLTAEMETVHREVVDPGPIDGSVLYMQSTHRSSPIWEGQLKHDLSSLLVIRNLSTSSKQCAKVVRQDQKSLESQIAGYCFVDFAGIRLQQKSWGLPVYKKHYPPALHDEVWRLDTIAKDGALHKKLIKDEITKVEDFLRVLVRDPQRLRNILGSVMSNRMWENTVEHAKTCVLGGKLYVYYSDESQSSGAAFNHIYELSGLIADGHFLPLESLNQNQKISVDSLVKRAYENWNEVVEYDSRVLNSLSNREWSRPRDDQGLEDFFTEEIRLRSSEMLENDDMQRLLKTFNMGGVGLGSAFGHSDEACYSHNVPYEHQMDRTYGQERGRSSGKAVVGWLKLKAALRWGIFIRKRAAERRAQLVDVLQII
ncbi:hypothetical protein F0562_027358 [Nyssa sinensis]|uniref:Calmodulin-binding protein 60 E n=1 Tax=Nyssa sinensis TaxID=561372 RepID=A0A5J5B849_9ASTE|nr:hypothetical protein F0562_027358 [Nyssa sinensis]